SVAARAIGKVVRAPTRMRLSMSRPSWSAPNQNWLPGGLKRPRKSIFSGSTGASAGPSRQAAASSARIAIPSAPCGVRRSRRSQSLIADSLVEQRIGDIGEEIRHRICRGHDQSTGLDRRQVARLDRHDELAADARQREDLLDDDDAAEKI